MSEFKTINTDKVSYVEVPEDCAGQRLDNFLLARLKGVPKSRIYRLLRRGEVRVNKGRVKPHYRLQPGDSLRLPPLRQSEQAERSTRVPSRLLDELEQAVLYEDDSWLVVDKPAGLAVHGGSGLHFGLIEAMRSLRPDCHALELCHRLDKATSGCIVLAKKRSALKRFHQGLRERQLHKRYFALVVGRWSAAVDVVNVALEKNVLSSGERMVRASTDGKPSQTRFKVVQRFADCTLVEAEPVTGRTHQIRVHCKAAGHPIVGDEKYGNDKINQQFRARGQGFLFLHSGSVGIPEAEGEQRVASELPRAWQACLDALAGDAQR